MGSFVNAPAVFFSKKMVRRAGFTVLVLLILCFPAYRPAGGFSGGAADECTIGIASGSATADGRPMIWKTRDYSSAPNNEIYYNTADRYAFIGVVTANGRATSSPWMGVNERGFAILNSSSSDLPDTTIGPGNGTLMRIALGTCAVIGDFEALLDSTNGARQTQANFAVMDSSGAAAIYETSGFEYWKYDADDPAAAPDGYIVKTNFAHHGDGSGGGYERYNRTAHLIAGFYAGDSLNCRSILRTQMRDFSDFDSDPVPVPFQGQWLSYRPYGYIYTGVSICRASSVSAAVIQGVLPGEPAKLSTLWAMLGQPASSITVPYWSVGSAPGAAAGGSTAPLADRANEIRALLFDYSENSNYIDSYKLRDEQGNGLWARTFPAEDSIFTAAEALLDGWRSSPPDEPAMLAAEAAFADYALSVLSQAYAGLIVDVPPAEKGGFPAVCTLRQNYPNPFNATTTVRFDLRRGARVKIAVFDILGRYVATIADGKMTAGTHRITWDAGGLPSGVYIIRLSGDGFTLSRKALLLK